jgi:hypothetical protein
MQKKILFEVILQIKYTIESDGNLELFMGVYFHSNVPMSAFYTN